MAAFNLKITAALPENDTKFFTPIPTPIQKKLFYTPLPDYKFDNEQRLSFLPAFKNSKKKEKTEKLAKCESLARITLILTKYQKWIRKKKCIVQKWDDDSDSDEDSDDDSDSDESSDIDSDEEMGDDEKMNLALFQQFAYGNNQMVEKIKKNQVYNWINKELSKNYSEARLLEDYLHLLNEHKDEFEQIHNHLCEAMDKQIKPNDNFKESYYCYSAENAYNADINIEQLLDEIQLHFGGIFDKTFFDQKYKIIKQIGTGIEGDVHKVKLRKQYESFVLDIDDINDDDDDEKGGNSSSSSDDEDDDNCYYYAAKSIKYNERTMNNYRVMGKFSILDDFEMYLDKKNDKLLLVSELWDCDIFDYMKENGKTFNEKELKRMMKDYILPLLFKLHSNHYIHGDIKPNNFVMNIGDNFGDNYGLIDFGTMLKMNELSETIRSSLIGSMGYHSPEIIFSMYDGPIKIDTKVDIWSLGLTMIYLLIATHPLINDDLNILGERKLKIKLNKCLEKLQKTNKISNNLKDLLNNMLQIKPIKRYNIYQIYEHDWITEKEKQDIKCILFLDIDGVLNDSRSRPKTLRPELIMKLKKIINLTQCNIVLSSSWRRVSELKKKFIKQFKKIARLDIDTIYIGDTPSNGSNPTRIHEIMEYFEKNENNLIKPNKINWVVVDDMDLLNENQAFNKELEKFISGHWVQTKIDTGLTNENVEEIISILLE